MSGEHPAMVQAPLTLAPDEAAIMQQFTVLNRRRRKFNTLSAAGRIEELLEALEEVEDPAEAVRLARTIRDNLVIFKHDAALVRMQQALGCLPLNTQPSSSNPRALNPSRHNQHTRRTRAGTHSGGNPGKNIKSISHRCHPILVAYV